MKILVLNTRDFTEVEVSTERKMIRRRGCSSRTLITSFSKLEFGLKTLDTAFKMKATHLKLGVPSYNHKIMMMAAKSSALLTLSAQAMSSTMVMINAGTFMDLSRVTNLKVLTIFAISNQSIPD